MAFGLVSRSRNRPGHEGDRFVLRIYNRDTGEVYPLTEALDRPVRSFAWSPDSRRLFFIAEDRGRAPIFTVKVGGGATQLAVYGEACYSDVQLLPDGKSMIYRADRRHQPGGDLPGVLHWRASVGHHANERVAV